VANTLAYLSPSIRDKKGFTRMILGVIGMKLFSLSLTQVGMFVPGKLFQNSLTLARNTRAEHQMWQTL